MLKNTILLTLTALVLTTGCTVTEPVSKLQAYNGLYTEKPVSLLIMPPINRSTNVEAKEYSHTTLNVPIANAGYYVIPPFLSMDILKRESAYDAELFLDAPLAKFGEVFGADMALFTYISLQINRAVNKQLYLYCYGEKDTFYDKNQDRNSSGFA